MVAGDSEMLKADVVLRRAKFQDLLSNYAAEVNCRFSDVLMQVGATGRIDFGMGSSSDDGAVTMRVLFDAASKLSEMQGAQVDSGVLQTHESLSGGEKAFAVLAFFMAAARVVRKSRGQSRQSASHSTPPPRTATELPLRCIDDFGAHMEYALRMVRRCSYHVSGCCLNTCSSPTPAQRATSMFLAEALTCVRPGGSVFSARWPSTGPPCPAVASPCRMNQNQQCIVLTPHDISAAVCLSQTQMAFIKVTTLDCGGTTAGNAAATGAGGGDSDE